MGLVVSGELLLEVVTEVGGELDSVAVMVGVVVLVGARAFCCRRFCRYSRLIICRLVSWEAAGLVVSVGSWLGVMTVVERGVDWVGVEVELVELVVVVAGLSNLSR